MKKLVKILLYLTLFATFFLLDRFAFPHPVLRVLAMAFGVLLGAALLNLLLGLFAAGRGAQRHRHKRKHPGAGVRLRRGKPGGRRGDRLLPAV